MALITTRDARAADAPEIAQMIAQLAAHHEDIAKIDEEELIFLCFGPAPWLSLLVAEQDGRLIGYAALQRKTQLQFARRLMDVQHLFVASQARGTGVGRALMVAASEHAKLHRCAGITLGVMAQNTKARGFYEAIGFAQHETSGAVQMLRRLDLQEPSCAL